MIFKSFDGKDIFVYEWTIVPEPKGVVQIVHGRAEHAARYEAFARYLNANGYIVVADDHRGHGRTDEGSLGYCKGNMFEDTLKDEVEITKHFQKKYAGLSYFLLGFSYGSYLAQSYLARYGSLIDGAVIAGSSYKKDIQVYMGSLLSGAACLFGMAKKPAELIKDLSFGAWNKKFGGDGEWLSIDPDNNLKYAQDPLCGFTCSYRFYKDLFKGLRKLYTRKYRNQLRKDLPLLLVSGNHDAVGEMGAGVEKLAKFYREKAEVQNVEVVLFERSRHEFLNEQLDRDLKWETVKNFFDKICEEKF